MTCTIVQKGLDMNPLYFYHHLRKIGYTHRSAVVSVLMYYSPSKEDLHKRLKRRYDYYQPRGGGTTLTRWVAEQLNEEPKEQAYCICCGRGAVKVFSCPECGEYICQDCAPDFGAHTCEPD